MTDRGPGARTGCNQLLGWLRACLRNVCTNRRVCIALSEETPRESCANGLPCSAALQQLHRFRDILLDASSFHKLEGQAAFAQSDRLALLLGEGASPCRPLGR